jgi:hypothetical protein
VSIFGPVTDVDRHRWQQRNLKALSELVQLGVKKKLAPLFWTLPDIGNVCGKVQVLGRDQDPHEVFEAWFNALSKLQGVEPRNLGFRGEGAPRSERVINGQTRLLAGFTMRLPAGRCDIALLAEWFADDPAPVDDEPAGA